MNWVDDFWQAMRPHTSDRAYQNFIDPALDDWQHAYYGANLARLESIKGGIDPHDIFRFLQSIPVRR